MLYNSFAAIDTFIFDVDGVMTDSTLLVQENGDLLRTMNVRDGFALKLAVTLGYNIIVITGGNSPGVKIRLEKLGIDRVYLKTFKKLEIFEDLVGSKEIDPLRTAYMGDDLIDLSVLHRVGLSAAPADAVAEVLAMVNYISPFRGGQGCVRDLIEKVLKIQERWPDYTQLDSPGV